MRAHRFLPMVDRLDAKILLSGNPVPPAPAPSVDLSFGPGDDVNLVQMLEWYIDNGVSWTNDPENPSIDTSDLPSSGVWTVSSTTNSSGTLFIQLVETSQ